METSFAGGDTASLFRLLGISGSRPIENAALLSFAQAARATISLMSNSGAMMIGALADRRMRKVCQAWVS
jgi:hypothetical protein